MDRGRASAQTSLLKAAERTSWTASREVTHPKSCVACGQGRGLWWPGGHGAEGGASLGLDEVEWGSGIVEAVSGGEGRNNIVSVSIRSWLRKPESFHLVVFIRKTHSYLNSHTLFSLFQG